MNLSRIRPKTVRAKLILTTMLVIGAVLAVLGVTVDVAARSTLLGVIDRDLKMRGDDLARTIERSQPGPGMPGQREFRRGPNGPPVEGGPPRGQGGPPPGQSVRVRDSRISAPVVIPVLREPQDGRPLPEPIDESAKDRAIQTGPIFSDIVLNGEPRRVYSTPVRREGRVDSVIQLSYPMGEVLDALARLRGILLTVMLPLGVLLAMGASFLVVNRLLAPLKRMTGEAERIGGGTLSERLRVMGEDEFAALASTLNGMLGRIEQNFEQQRRFTADASHELKTPLSVIKANIGIVRHGKPTADEVRESAEAIDLAADRMGALVRDLLVLARADAGRPSTEIRVCDLRAVATEAIKGLPDGERIRLAMEDAPVTVLASPEDLARVVVNLADNALKHGGEGEPVDVQVGAESGMATFRVTDRGAGIAPEHVDHLFERFYRPDSSRTRASGGTGLGLAICKGIVELHGGTIEVASEIGTGTEVTVRLPLG